MPALSRIYGLHERDLWDMPESLRDRYLADLARLSGIAGGDDGP